MLSDSLRPPAPNGDFKWKNKPSNLTRRSQETGRTHVAEDSKIVIEIVKQKTHLNGFQEQNTTRATVAKSILKRGVKYTKRVLLTSKNNK